MIIVSNEFVKKPFSKFLSYKEFVDQAYSDEGLDMDDGLAININNLSQDVFNDLKDLNDIIFFATNSSRPSFASGMNIEDWSGFAMKNEQPKAAQPEINQNQVNEADNQQMSDFDDMLDDLIDGSISDEFVPTANNDAPKNARIIVFGSSKGGTGKTFTSIISTYRYAKTHPDQKVALIDFDIIDGQVGVSIHKLRPTMAKYYVEYQKGYRDFKTMNNFAVKGNRMFPQNVDFYLAPSGFPIENNDFWLNILQNCIENYDVAVFDTGIDYLNIVPISYVYKAADKINLLTTTSIKSVNSVTKQIGRLKGEIKSPGRDEDGNLTDYVFTEEDDIAPKLNVIITQMVDTNKMNTKIYQKLSSKVNVIATFGIISESVAAAEYDGQWDVFDKNNLICQSLDNIMA